MAVNSVFFIDAANLTLAISVYLDSSLSIIAPDGFYGDGTVLRQQSAGILLAPEICPSCAPPCGIFIYPEGGGDDGFYIAEQNVGFTTGAIIIEFDPQSIPDGIRAIYDGVVYNKLSSPVDGLHQSTTYGNFTVVGATGDDCGLSGNTSVFPSNPEYLWNGTVFVATGNTQSVTFFPGDISLNAASPDFCVMVIPKTSAIPDNLVIQVFGPCGGTAWNLRAKCPALLPSFPSSDVSEVKDIPCGEPMPNTYYFAKVHIEVDTYVGLYDYVFLDENGEFPLANGFYLTSNVAIPNRVIQVSSGIVIGSTNCIYPPPPDCPNRRVVFQICNENEEIDDNFDIYLNGIYIGAVDLNSNAQVGSVFIADLNPSITLASSDFACPIIDMVTYYFDPTILSSVNVIEMINTQNNGNNNLGTIGIRNYLLTGDSLSDPCVIDDLDYAGNSGLDFTLGFSYTECCP